MAYKRRTPQPVLEGGTGVNTFSNSNGTVYFDGSVLQTISPGTTQYLLKSQGAGSPPAFFTNDLFWTGTESQGYIADDTYNKSAEAVYVIFQAIGGGGGGGGVAQGTNANHIAAAGGGGAGAFEYWLYHASDLPSTLSITVGAGGAGGAAGNNPGANGGTSRIFDGSGDFIIALGGSGGSGSPESLATSIINGGGPGGTVGASDYWDSQGAPGSAGMGCYVTALNRWATGGAGGSSYLGGGALSTIVGVTSAVTAGINAGNYGSGGSGACSTGIQAAAAGGNGSGGLVIITEIYAKDS